MVGIVTYVNFETKQMKKALGFILNTAIHVWCLDTAEMMIYWLSAYYAAHTQMHAQHSGPIYTKVSSLQIVAACSDDISYFALCMRHLFHQVGKQKDWDGKQDKIDAICHNNRTYYRLYYVGTIAVFFNLPQAFFLMSSIKAL